MKLEVFAQMAAVAAWLILSYTVAKPVINKWAVTRGLVYYAELEPLELFTEEQARLLPWRRRWMHFRRRWRFQVVQRLMPRLDRFLLLDRWNSCERALKIGGSDSLIKITSLAKANPPFDPLIQESVLVIVERRKKRQRSRLQRTHKRVRCAACGIGYGKRRKDHNFSGGGGIEGGWHCPSSTSCRERSTGDHFCGMCDNERNDVFAEIGLPNEEDLMVESQCETDGTLAEHVAN